VVSAPLELERDRPNGFRILRNAFPRHRFDYLAVGSAVADGRVSRNGFHMEWSNRKGAAPETFLDSAMLVAKGNFKVMDGFPVALKSEVSRLNDSRMHRPDGYLMDFVPVNAEKINLSDWRNGNRRAWG
jgi:hypothetical protein